MGKTDSKLQAITQKAIKQIYKELDYVALAPIYCDEGGEEFWKAHRGLCERLGEKLAGHLKTQLSLKGKSLYVGAGVAEIPCLLMEIFDQERNVAAYNLRKKEVEILNRVCQSFGLSFYSADAQQAIGLYDHLWIVSVLNDPERFPDLSALSYGRANPATFDSIQFQRERETVFTLTDNCLKKLTIPGLVTTSVEEIPWITNWCDRQHLPYSIDEKDHPTAIVKDPICLIQIG